LPNKVTSAIKSSIARNNNNEDSPLPTSNVPKHSVGDTITIDKKVWNIIHKPASGAQASVFFARSQTGEEAFIKQFHPKENMQKRVEREVEALNKLQNEDGFPKLIQAQLPYVVMSKIDGENLKSRTSVSPKFALSIFIQLLQRVQVLHQHTIFHRDIKPENLMIDKNNKLYVVDFGICYMKDELPPTADGEPLGPVKFCDLAELRKGSKHKRDPRSDVALCCAVVWHLLSPQEHTINSDTAVAQLCADNALLSVLGANHQYIFHALYWGLQANFEDRIPLQDLIAFLTRDSLAADHPKKQYKCVVDVVRLDLETILKSALTPLKTGNFSKAVKIGKDTVTIQCEISSRMQFSMIRESYIIKLFMSDQKEILIISHGLVDLQNVIDTITSSVIEQLTRMASK